MLARSSASREVVIVLVATFLMIGAFDVLAVVLALGSLGIGGSGAGYLTATHGAGAVAGALASFALVGRARLVPVMIGAALLAAIAFCSSGIETSILVASSSPRCRASREACSRHRSDASAARHLYRTAGARLCVQGGPHDGRMGARLGHRPSRHRDRRRAWGAVRTGAIVPAIVLLRLRPLQRPTPRLLSPSSRSRCSGPCRSSVRSRCRHSKGSRRRRTTCLFQQARRLSAKVSAVTGTTRSPTAR